MARIRIREETEEETESSPQTPQVKLDSPKKHPTIFLVSAGQIKLIAGLMLILGFGLYLYALTLERNELRTQVSVLKSDPAIVARKNTEDLIAKVSRLVELPANESPTIADVTDVVKARAQDKFYADAQNGDKVLFYTKAGKAILYRPTTNKVITIAPITQQNIKP